MAGIHDYEVLHVTLGNPLTHEGGLNRYCLDLVTVQKSMGMRVAILYPGSYTDKDKIKIVRDGKDLYKVMNALPIPVTYGISEPARYMNKTQITEYKKWICSINPRVIHVHSFMGIHKEFFLAAKEIGIRMVFTTHDYFPFCFKVNLLNNNSVCNGVFEPYKCAICNYNCGLSRRTQMIMQSDIYKAIKETKLFSFFRKKKSKMVSDAYMSEQTSHIKDSQIQLYSSLHKYYLEIVHQFDVVHCNSRVAQDFYSRAYPDLNYKYVPITHSGINKAIHVRKDATLRISYFGGMSIHKGYTQLKRLISLLPENDSWEMNLYGGSFNDDYPSNVHPIGYFTTDEEDYVWENTDVLLFISQWPETFGFGVLEAISKNVPVICSDIAGSSCLLDTVANHCVYEHANVNDLYKKVLYLIDMKNYVAIQEKIRTLEVDMSMKNHAKRMLSLYNGDEND